MYFYILFSFKSSMKESPTVVSLFSGAGGLDLGFKNAGYSLLWANDFDSSAVNTYRKNIGEYIVLGDIRQIPIETIPDNPDVIIGGFPCQGFSINNKYRCIEDERNTLYKELFKVIRAKQPKFFVAENVRGLLSMNNGQVIKTIVQDFNSIGYDVSYRLLNAAEYGVPQNRERVIIVGNRLGVPNPYPETTHYIPDNKNQRLTDKQKAVTTKEAIGYLDEVPLSEEPIQINGNMVYNHIARTNVSDIFFKRQYDVKQEDICDYLREWRAKSSYKIRDFDRIFGYKDTASHWFRKDNGYGCIPSPEEWWKLKELLKFDDRYDKQVTTLIESPITFEQQLRLVRWDKPSATILATNPEIHINRKRRLSVRECAILQSFPDNFVFTGSMSNMYRQIGNAVPPLLGQRIAECIKGYL